MKATLLQNKIIQESILGAFLRVNNQIAKVTEEITYLDYHQFYSAKRHFIEGALDSTFEYISKYNKKLKRAYTYTDSIQYSLIEGEITFRLEDSPPEKYYKIRKKNLRTTKTYINKLEAIMKEAEQYQIAKKG